MSTTNDGGPAFPQPFQFRHSDGQPMFPTEYYKESGGITIRDYFAAAALQGMMAAGDKWSWRDTDAEPAPSAVANEAYAIADAMIKERSRQ